MREDDTYVKYHLIGYDSDQPEIENEERTWW